MRTDMSKYFTMAIAGMTAVLLGACSESGTVSLSGDDFTRIADSIARKEDRITADDLARWIAEDTRDFVIVDVRPEEDFTAGHINGSLNISLPMLVSAEGRKRIRNSQTVVVYSNGSEYAAKAAVMLRLAGIQASFLLGGYNHWGSYILNPEQDTDQADSELLTFTERRALTCSFCGVDGISGYSPPVQAVTAPPRDEGKGSSAAPQQSKNKTDKAVVSEGC
ncbi:MAG: rhodanese-like domain-containing protein [Gammaproteobacteria bacterium]|nr:rhodanese-like domain-containing protein [Gammaproteobacteria bacterium]